METAAVAQSRNLTVDEIVEAIEGLTEHNYLTIDNVGRAYSMGLRGWDTNDLMQEALKRLVEERRHMPQNVNFVYGVIEIMRSLADERRAQQMRFWVDNDDEMPDRVVDEDSLRALVEEETLKEWQERVGNDTTASDVLSLRAEGYKPDEICKRLSIKRTTYDSANKRIRRAALKEREDID